MNCGWSSEARAGKEGGCKEWTAGSCPLPLGHPKGLCQFTWWVSGSQDLGDLRRHFAVGSSMISKMLFEAALVVWIFCCPMAMGILKASLPVGGGGLSELLAEIHSPTSLYS